MNLITNAYHAMENGGNLDISLSKKTLDIHHPSNKTMDPGPFVCLTVSDTGIGMKKSIIEKIFDPYFTTKETGKGTGLGLSVVHGIVKGYNGNILVESELGKGTSISVFLPMIKSIIDDRPNINAFSTITRGLPPNPKYKCFILKKGK